METYTVAGIDMSDLYPAPFPEDVPTVKLETISLAKLIANDEDEARRLFENCKDPGFFNLDLTDHPDGVQLLKDAVACARLTKAIIPHHAHGGEEDVQDAVAHRHLRYGGDVRRVARAEARDWR